MWCCPSVSLVVFFCAELFPCSRTTDFFTSELLGIQQTLLNSLNVSWRIMITMINSVQHLVWNNVRCLSCCNSEKPQIMFTHSIRNVHQRPFSQYVNFSRNTGILWSSVARYWDTGIRGLMRGMATLPQGNQELLVVRDKVGRPPGELGVSKSMKCDIFLPWFDTVVWATGRASGL